MATNTYETRLLTADLDQMRKSDMVQLCRGLGLPHGGLKAAVESRLRTKLSELQSVTPTPTATSTGPDTTSVAATFTATTAPTTVVSVSPALAGQPPYPPHLQAIAQQAAQQALALALGSAPPAPPLPPMLHLGTGTQTTAATLPTALPPLPSTSSNTTVPWTMQPMQPPTLPGSSRPPATLPTASPQSAPTAYPAYTPAAAPTVRPVTASPPYLPPAASPADIHALQTQLAAATPAPSVHRMGIPPLPARLQARVLAGEFVDMPDILHALELDAGEELPINLEVGEGHQLTLSRKRKRKEIRDFATWSQCFSVYAAIIASAQPTRGVDLMAYHYIVATAAREYGSTAFLAYDIAFRRKAAQYSLASWGEIDPHIYTKAFTAAPRPSYQCSICTSLYHSTADCPLYTGGSARQPRTTPAGPRMRTVPTPTYASAPSHQGKPVCLNWNRNRCPRESGCSRAHVCNMPGCQGPHRASACPSRRTSPRKV